MAINPCAKKRTKEDPYEIWETPDGTWKYLVLKKHKATVTSDFDRWYCCTISPITPQGEYGDAYVSTVTSGTTKVFDCFAQTDTDVQTGEQV